jgi:DUF1680 family protein
MWSYSETSDAKRVEIQVNLFNAGTLTCPLSNGKAAMLQLETDYPWGGELKFTLDIPQDTVATILIRIPHWSQDFRVSHNGVLIRSGACMANKICSLLIA